MIIFLLLFLSLSTLCNKPVVLYVHLGKNWVEYLNTSINQVKKFNPDIDIYLISDKDSFLKVTNKDVKLIDYEKLNKSFEHIKFIENHQLSQGFWQFASERFFYIQNFILDTGMKNIIHLESDIMIYCNLQEQFNKFIQLSKKETSIGATFDSDNRCIPGIVFIKGSMTNLLNTFNIELKNRLNDMQAISQFRKKYPNNCIALPIITPEYHNEYGLRSLINETPENPNIYFEHSDYFDSIFDAASLGQFLGGIDPIHLNNGSGFINETCIFNPSMLFISWEQDNNNKFYLPYIKHRNRKYKINNLHIHCKRLKDFTDKAIELEIYKIKTNLKNDLDEKIKNMNANIDSLIMFFEKDQLSNSDAIKYLKYLKLTN